MRIRYLAWLIPVTMVAFLAYCATHIPTGRDHDTATQVGEYIASGYGKFDDRTVVERTGKGKIYYVSPASEQSPTLIFYEVTTPEDISQIQTLANEALKAIPEARGIYLHFHHKQNLTISPNGGASRGWESAFKKVRVTRQQANKSGA
jgi:hypothetical protein